MGSAGEASTAEAAYERAVAAAMAAATRDLARRDHTTAELRRRLVERGHDPDAIEQVLGELAETQAVDDRRFAIAYAADKREFSGWGEQRIRAALAERGLGAADIHAATNAAEDDEVERAVALLRRRPAPIDDDRARQRALAMLARRGYDLEVAYAAIREAGRAA